MCICQVTDWVKSNKSYIGEAGVAHAVVHAFGS